ncbi:TIGR04190 family B12-binding domain/radical SAM domain protein [Bacillus sp. EB106-08-02-XG196]|uniref:TIGR04190 family B12-binding domain/radical SAM domain protein n=1 Tax=Bacillus sp. EB106-08-02-XG196 TaxID=2737049 RepID=UPI0015C47E8E|nr:TIGR04190 family B12-binding domain/radical SAM domain protein [Bacillus sp. EB106-08-02-XG196]NWQ41645.1 TIGR04190 family B12-binding domain/radical SAM domain protein [Bacillus sp. EB106-08-02-XG196]
MIYDLVLLHPPTVYDFRKEMLFTGPISDVVPSSPVFEMYPVGLTSIGDYLERYGLKVKIVNIANRMLLNPKFDVEKKIKNIKAKAFGIDLHWLPHAHGSVELAKIVKKYHPETPVMFGGLSSTYFHKELIEYPCIDFVVRGDTTEKLILMLLNKLEKKDVSGFADIPNLTWKRNNQYFYNEITYVPDSLDEFNLPGYRYVIGSVFKYFNLLDPLPYKGWLQYPNTALLTSKGCNYNCLICGGSKDAYELNCNRKKLVMRSPQKMLEDIALIQRFTRAPIFLLNDIRQGGKEYVDEFLDGLAKMKIKNEIVFELFNYADEKFFERLNKAMPKYSIELTLESADEDIRKYNGKLPCTNARVIEMLQFALKQGCAKIDLFFMTGIPNQTYDSAMRNVDFCENIHKECGEASNISYFVAPLSPFLDPGSPAFENPEKYGYKKFCNKLEDFREAMKQPSWKNMLSYETNSMTREEIVKATYDSALKLNEFKYKNHIITKEVRDEVRLKIEKSVEFLARLDALEFLPEEEKQKELTIIKKEVDQINRHSICGENELKWEVKKLFANFPSLTYIGLELLIKDVVKDLKCKFGKIDRDQVMVTNPSGNEHEK